MVFDFYGTLARAVRWGPPFEEVLAGWGLSPPGDGDLPWATEDGLDHAEHSTDRDTYVAWEHARLRRLAAAWGAPDDDAVAADLYRASKDFLLEAFPEVTGVLVELDERGLQLAVCSNWDWDLDRALAQAGLTDLVGHVVTSAQAGARKPHPRIFGTTLAALAVEPASALFVGDTWDADVEGAVAAGMEVLHVVRTDAPPGDPPPLLPGVHRAPDLTGVLDLL